MTFKIRKFLLLVTALLFAFLGWFLCIDIASSVFWRVWHFNDRRIPTMWIGLWKVCYLQRYPEFKYTTTVCVKIDSSWNIPTEFYYFQDMILVPIFLQGIGLILSLAAFLILSKNETFPRFADACHMIAGCCFIISSLSIGISVTWSTYMDLSDKNKIQFPTNFPVQTNQIARKETGLAFPLGISCATCSLTSGTFFLCERYCSKFDQVHPQNIITEV